MPNIPRDIVARPFYYAQQNTPAKIFTEYILKNEWAWEKNCFPSNHFLLLKGTLELLIWIELATVKDSIFLAYRGTLPIN